MNLEHSWSYNCMEKGAIAHEFMHVLGFHHMHQSPDRDEFIEVHTKNLPNDDTVLDSFRKKKKSDWNDIGGFGFDFDSLMMYGRPDGSKNSKEVIEVKDEYRNVAGNLGQRSQLSPADVYKINILYDCPVEDYPRNAEENIRIREKQGIKTDY